MTSTPLQLTLTSFPVLQVMVTICLSKKMKYLATARCLLVGYIAVAVVLNTISADRFNNLRNVTAHRGSVRSS